LEGFGFGFVESGMKDALKKKNTDTNITRD
jgi:hypothetical protein